ncbi:ArsR/SmtB family transcription factor [Dyella telluris]|uniref:Helix-turn-helix transcriptional regulator n=1 Tax=Dyella telluris TaxID=2763498 RepID=A0A7G8Q8F5_9GAMM|nr:helix-turn-helix transcriptional regulator [Dyella telluris]QNK03063.1 helix-turn-helix transcriptional regulator [Dyella telluris]
MNDAISPSRYQLAEIGALLAEPARAAMLLALIDGTMRPAGELARVAGVSAATGSAHLRRLLEGGLLAVHEQGRHRYYHLANDDVAALIEALALPRTPMALPDPSGGDRPLRMARTCYRHLAGRLGVGLCDVLLQRGFVLAASEGMRLHEEGAQALVDAGLDAARVQALLPLAGRGCLDWTERRLHLGGPLGVSLTDTLLDAGWLRRSPRGRALSPSVDGLRRLAALGVRWPEA